MRTKRWALARGWDDETASLVFRIEPTHRNLDRTGGRRIEAAHLSAPMVFTGAKTLVLLVLTALQEQQGHMEVFVKVIQS